MSQGPNADILRAMQQDAIKEAPASEDKLDQLRKAVAAQRDRLYEKSELEERLKRLNQAIYETEMKTLPDLFAEARVKDITIEAEGNLPAYKAKADSFFKANIPAEWPEEQRRQAFEYLDSIGHGDLIKTDVIVAYPREKRSEALKFLASQREAGQNVVAKEGVQWNTLTKWLKEQVEDKGFTPDLDKIGGTVGRIVKLKPLD